MQIGISLAALCGLFFAIRNERNENIRLLMAACAALVVSAYMQSCGLSLLVAVVAGICASKERASQFDRSEFVIVILSATLPMFIAWLTAVATRVNISRWYCSGFCRGSAGEHQRQHAAAGRTDFSPRAPGKLSRDVKAAVDRLSRQILSFGGLC